MSCQTIPSDGRCPTCNGTLESCRCGDRPGHPRDTGGAS